MAKESERPTIFIQNHQGLGDMLVANAIFRHFAETHNVFLPVKFHNVPSVQWMLKGLPVALLGVQDDEGAKNLAAAAERRGARVLRLGMFGKGFDEKRWDSVMFAQAGVPFEDRWSKWHVERDLSREFEPPKREYAFIHEDVPRGFTINATRLPYLSSLRYIGVNAFSTDKIFDYCRLIENATELHLIDSCFAILADSLPNLKAKRFVVHAYARPNALPPSYRNNVELLRT